MNADLSIPSVLETLSLIVLSGLVLFQWLHFVLAGWSFWRHSRYRLRNTAAVGLFWIAYGLFFVGTVTRIDSYVDAIPWVLAGLYTPSVLALLLFAFSGSFRRFGDRLSLRWTIQSVEGPARMIVGVFFLFWYFAGQLPGVVAWVAGPGDWIAGFISFYAVGHLLAFSDWAGIRNPHWSLADFRTQSPGKLTARQWTRLHRKLWIAIAFVAFGILDFIAAPASTAVSIALGEVPEEMGRLPLTLIPLVLVPQVLLLEVFALRQLLGLKRYLKRHWPAASFGQFPGNPAGEPARSQGRLHRTVPRI